MKSIQTGTGKTKQPRKARLRIIIISILIILIVITTGYLVLYGNAIRTMLSLTKVGDQPLYVMHYYGGYYFDKYLIKGVKIKNNILSSMPKNDTACSCFSAKNKNGELLMGRNLDWSGPSELGLSLLVFTDPPGGYASVSMVNMYYMGYKPDDAPTASLFNRTRLLSAPYSSLDGMNEYGLTVEVNQVPHSEAGSDPKKVTLRDGNIIRLVLDYAKDVPEAISLIQKYNILFTTPCHFMLYDASGDSAIIEFLNGEIKVIREKEPWQASTNFLIYNTTPESRPLRCQRYGIIAKTLSQSAGIITDHDVMNLLKDISITGHTTWSVVYNMSSGDIQIATVRNYDKIAKFKLKMKN